MREKHNKRCGQEVSRHQQVEEEGPVDASLAQAILDSMDVSVAILDAEGIICAVNEVWRRQQRETCTTDHQLERTGIGVNYLEICKRAQGAYAEEAPEALAGLQAVLEGAQPAFSLEYPCFSPTQRNWYLMSVTPLPQQRGAVVAHIDITKRKRFDQQKDTFIALAAHELRTPLAALKGLVQLQRKREKNQGKEEHGRFFTKVEAQIEHLTKLVSELLDVSKMQAGTLDYVEEIIDLEKFLKESVEVLQQAYPGQQLNFQSIPTVVWIIGDRGKLTQVIMNLLNNAILYSPQANPVDLSLLVVDDTACIHIQDYGIGIPREDLEHLFEPFYRVQRPRHYHAPGLGMGLYIAQEIVKHHRGTLSVTSEEGRGSTFSIQLPLWKAPF